MSKTEEDIRLQLRQEITDLVMFKYRDLPKYILAQEMISAGACTAIHEGVAPKTAKNLFECCLNAAIKIQSQASKNKEQIVLPFTPIIIEA
jgi:hypothetical protein